MTAWTDDFHRFVSDRADALAEAIEWVWDLVPHPVKAAMTAVDDARDVDFEEED